MPGGTLAETKQAVDIWEKIAGLSDDKKLDYDVELHRILPQEDPLGRVKFPIGGHCGRLKLAQLTREVMYNKVGGGTYKVFIRHSQKGTKFAEGKVEFPGPPVLIFPESLEPIVQKQTNSPATPAGRTYEEGIADGLRKAERESELKEIHDLLSEIRQERRNSNGNGNGKGARNDFLDAVAAVGKLKEVVGLGAGQGNGIDTLALLQLLKDERNAGQTQGERFAELMAQANSGTDQDAIVEKEMIGVLRDIIGASKAKKRNSLTPAPTAGKQLTPAQLVYGAFVKFRDETAQVIADYDAFAASSLKGSENMDVYLTNLRKILDMVFAEEEEDEVEGANETPKQPGPDSPESGGPGPGGKDTDTPAP